MWTAGRPSIGAVSARVLAIGCVSTLATACGGAAPHRDPAPVAQHLLLVTIDTLRADRLGVYGHAPARTPAIDGLAARGVRFTRAFATAPITLPSHASLMTGRYPPAHGSRHNGMAMAPGVPTLAESLRRAGVATAAFVGAFPLDRRFGLDRGFDVYGDRMPRGPDGRPANERPGQQVVDEALAWMATHRSDRMFVWVHLFEPHAPYGVAADGRPVAARYDDDVAEADRQLGRLLEGLGPSRDQTLVVVTADHGEAFGEHGEIGHSVFVYDTTLRVPLVVAGPGLEPRLIESDVALVDVAPTLSALLGAGQFAADGVDLTGVVSGAAVPARELYAESFAPLLDFGWSPLRSLRGSGLKVIAAPRPELFDLAVDAGEVTNLADADRARTTSWLARVDRRSPASIAAGPAADPDAARRLQALGYAAGATPAGGGRADPKDRRELAARLAQVTSGEVTGFALETTLRQILADDPGNPQAHLRLGFVLADANRCATAEPEFAAAIAARMPTADAHLGLAGCLARRGRPAEAARVLAQADEAEPDNPVVAANRGVLLSDAGRPAEAVPQLMRAVELDPDFHQARFALAIALARSGQREPAAAQARHLLDRLDPAAPQRPEVVRLLAALQ
jgi:choline-sulfatase